jgi:hypothetical protein
MTRNSTKPLGEIVALLRRYKEKGIARAEVYAHLERLHTPRPMRRRMIASWK